LAQDGESLIEKYSKGISSVNEILRTDRISQQIVLRDMLTKIMRIPSQPLFSPTAGRTNSQLPPPIMGGGGMRKTISVPNMKYFRTSLSSDNLANAAAGGHLAAGGHTMMRMSDSFHEGCTISGSNNQLFMTASGGGRKMRQSFGEEQMRGIPTRGARGMTTSKTMTTLHEECSGNNPSSHTAANHSFDNKCIVENGDNNAESTVITNRCDNSNPIDQVRY